jgi:hypothetical protein
MEPPSDSIAWFKHQWPYLSWDDIGVLTSPLFWTVVALLFVGLFFVARRILHFLVPFVPVGGLYGFLCGDLIATYSVLMLLLAGLALCRCDRPVKWTVLIMALVGDALLLLEYLLCLHDYYQMSLGPGLHKIPGELWEGMQGVQAFLIFHSIFVVIWGIYLYRTRPRRVILPS